MKSRIATAAACLVGLAISAPASAVFIDFESLPGGTPIVAEAALGNQFSSLGVTFSATEDGRTVTPSIQSPAVYFGEPAHSGVNYADNQMAGFGPSDGTNRADILTMLFGTTVSGVSFWVAPKGSQDPVFNAYDDNNILLESHTVDNDAGGAASWTLVSFAAANIRRIEGVQPSEIWNFGVDDLTFSQNVPEPASTALLALGLLGVAAARRRRAK